MVRPSTAISLARCGLAWSQQPLVSDVGKILVTEGDGSETALLVAERAVEGLLLRAARPGVREPTAQVHLPRDERDQRNCAATDRGLHQLGQLLRLAPEELTVLY